MKKLITILTIGLLTLSCGDKKGKPASDTQIQLANYSEINQMEKLEYLKTKVFVGLKNLNDGFDSESIYYFSESDFPIVLDRVENLGIGIMEIEPWLNGEFYDVMVFEDFNTISTDPKWYREAFLEFKKSGEKLQYAASYEISDELLNK